MSKKCTHCGSLNTELSLKGNVNWAARWIARGTVVGGVSFVAGIFNRYAAKGASRAMSMNTESWVKGIKRYHCCSCGKDFE